ncbi:hypothetical protein ONR57_11465 [Hoyosella sp. YIM 151337]|uniref:hypothetical protein n=1 Tax=Hoyosella sp. YIM 151337 TaxID=2992742 RepID=UPI002235F369|nr:hypothetical protein [Hoyosella sp. YIM 151337]MCW4353916.1 hypothetical protein [Hoyosella sp. YIM 151337]
MTSVMTRPSAATHTLSAMRLHTATLPQMLAWIAAILAAIFAVQFAIILAISGTSEQMNSSSPIVLAIFLFVFGVQSFAQTLPFALSLGLTRRAFFASTMLYGAALAFGLSLAAGVFALIEEATGGWGVDFIFFRVTTQIPAAPVAQWAMWPLVIFAGCVLGAFYGAVYQRWGTTGVWSVILTLLIVLGSVTVVNIWQGWWPAIWDAITELPLELIILGAPALLALGAGLTAFVVARRSPV